MVFVHDNQEKIQMLVYWWKNRWYLDLLACLLLSSYTVNGSKVLRPYWSRIYKNSLVKNTMTSVNNYRQKDKETEDRKKPAYPPASFRNKSYNLWCVCDTKFFYMKFAQCSLLTIACGFVINCTIYCIGYRDAYWWGMDLLGTIDRNHLSWPARQDNNCLHELFLIRRSR